MKAVQDLTYSEKLEIALKIKDTASFFVVYFNHLAKFKTHKECFLYFNKIHEDIFGTEKYSTYGSFKTVMGRDGKNYLRKKTR